MRNLRGPFRPKHRECEECPSEDAIERGDRVLCLSCWIQEIGRSRSDGTMDIVRRERSRRERTQAAVYDPAQLSVGEFGGGRA